MHAVDIAMNIDNNLRHGPNTLTVACNYAIISLDTVITGVGAASHSLAKIAILR